MVGAGSQLLRLISACSREHSKVQWDFWAAWGRTDLVSVEDLDDVIAGLDGAFLFSIRHAIEDPVRCDILALLFPGRMDEQTVLVELKGARPSLSKEDLDHHLLVLADASLIHDADNEIVQLQNRSFELTADGRLVVEVAQNSDNRSRLADKLVR